MWKLQETGCRASCHDLGNLYRDAEPASLPYPALRFLLIHAVTASPSEPMLITLGESTNPA